MFNNNILKRFIENLNNQPDNIAFYIDEIFYSYGELKIEICKIIEEINKLPTSNSPLGLVVNDDLTTYASIWAMWFEGLCYVPLHPKQPKERNLEIINQAQCKFILNSKIEESTKFESTIETGNSITITKEITIKNIPDSNYAYILFTSGSTGKPKGVPISRGNLSSFVDSFTRIGFEINSEDRFLQCFDLTFDVSVQCFVVPLIFGASVFTIPHHSIKYSYVYGLLEDHKLTFATMAPSMIRYLQPYFEELNLPNLKYNILTAEASYCSLVEDWSNCIPNAEIYNFYGPTEATIYCTYYRYEKNKPNAQINGVLSIGKPMKGITAIIIDENSNLITDTKKGEMYISGSQLSSGYLNESEKNKNSFIELDYKGNKQVFYKTGDICFFENDTLLYLGRVDHQVKIQGYRVELSEIEYHARQALKGKTTIALAFENFSKTNEIALFVEDEKLDEKKLKEYLKEKLPPYMIPSKILMKDEFPLNSNGKIDRKLLLLQLMETYG
jgi:D-alanine--poly(phosphoribitol) ligase subunit 1